MSEETFEQKFDVKKKTRLDVRNIRGTVDISPGEDGVIQVTALKHTDTGDAKRTEIELTQESNGTVNAFARFPDGALSGLFGARPCKVDFTIQVPSQCAVSVKCVSADTNVRGIHGEVKLNTVSGDINLEDLQGDLKVNAVSGDIDLAKVEGELELRTVSGDIDCSHASGPASLHTVSGDVCLKESSLPSINADSVSGDIELETPLGEGPYRFHSVSGEVHFKVPEGTQCTAELSSVSGHISTNLPQSTVSSRPGKQLVKVQGGGVEVFLKSVSGELTLVS